MGSGPLVNGGNSKSLLEFVNGFLGPTKLSMPGTQDTSSKKTKLTNEGRGNKNYRYSGIELQPLKSNARIGEISENDMFDTDSSLKPEDKQYQDEEEQDRIKQKLKKPPNFS